MSRCRRTGSSEQAGRFALLRYDSSMEGSTELPIQNTTLSSLQVFLCGVGIGALSYVIAELAIPKTANTPSSHDLALAHRIGFIFPALTGWWVGWLQRSLSRMIAGIAVGSGVGYLYAALCGSDPDFLAIMIGFPCFCGGLFAMLIGSNRDKWLNGMGARLIKGLLAGLACGVVYSVLLSVIAGITISNPYSMTQEDFVNGMWRAGPPALGIGGGVFFLLFRWAIRLNESERPAART